MAETLRKTGARLTDAPSQTRNGPAVCWLLVQKGEGFPDYGVTRPCQPTNLAGRKRADVAPQRLHEQQFRKLGKHQPATSRRVVHSVHREPDGMFEPLS